MVLVSAATGRGSGSQILKQGRVAPPCPFCAPVGGCLRDVDQSVKGADDKVSEGSFSLSSPNLQLLKRCIQIVENKVEYMSPHVTWVGKRCFEVGREVMWGRTR